MGIFMERQEVRRKKRWMKRLLQLERILISLAVVLGGLASIYGLYRMIIFGDTFAVNRIVVEGDWKYLTAERLAALTGVTEDESLFWISVDDIHDRLRSDPWVRTTAVRRRLPDTLWIYAEEHRPVAIIASKGLFYVDEYGEIFKIPEGDDDRNFPVLSGIDIGDNKSLSNKDRERVINMLRMLSLFEISEFGKSHNVAEIHYDENRGYSLITRKGPMQIFFGHTAFAQRIEQIDRIRSAVTKRPGRIKYIMANEPGRLIVKYHVS